MESLTHLSSSCGLSQNSKNWLTLASFPVVCTNKSISAIPCRIFPELYSLVGDDPTDLLPSARALDLVKVIDLFCYRAER